MGRACCALFLQENGVDEMAIERKKLLYFTADTSPTQADIEAIENYGWANIGFRAASFSSGIEPCHYVAGAVPAEYLEAGIPHADTRQKAGKAPTPPKGKETGKAATAPPAGGWNAPVTQS
jgi:hypothetical protein